MIDKIKKFFGISKPMVGFYFKISGIELAQHFKDRITELTNYEIRVKQSGLILTDKQMDSLIYKIQCYEFAVAHIDPSYIYFLDESEVGQWELIRAYDAFDKLDFGKPATPAQSKIVKPNFIH
jgi:hypothetical protein